MPDALRLDGDGNFRSPLLDQIPWLRHGFGTRAPAREELPTIFAKQTHSVTILDGCKAPGLCGEGDALINAIPGLAVAVKTADCVPVLLVDPTNRVVAAIHAGWRGTAGQIVRLTVERMSKMYGTKPTSLLAAIGPGIGQCCFEVGPEVAREFARWEPALAQAVGKHHLNLPGLNRMQLRDAGVPAGQIAQSELCTMCTIRHFFSYRREREEAGRMISFAGISGESPKTTETQ